MTSKSRVEKVALNNQVIRNVICFLKYFDNLFLPLDCFYAEGCKTGSIVAYQQFKSTC